MRECLGTDVEYDFEWIEAAGGTRSPMEGPLWDAIEAFVAESEPGAQAVPLIVPGFTDSHWVRSAFGTVSYGFFPMRTMDAETAARLIHSADERVPGRRSRARRALPAPRGQSRCKSGCAMTTCNGFRCRLAHEIRANGLTTVRRDFARVAPTRQAGLRRTPGSASAESPAAP